MTGALNFNANSQFNFEVRPWNSDGIVNSVDPVQEQSHLVLLCLSRLVGPKRNEQRHEKTNILVSDQLRHKLGCTATEDG